ncbi:MAG: hypothetical protein JRF27_01360 [Deltaproteobacteria bacterium]|jgi:hypothetical protein|nr:hypothetical protein [Deltaproteobacteria bacterium]MBW2192414.1 hypothetical protein [Deltaproteobacteria bacterium]
MRFYALLNLQHAVLWLFPTLVFMIVFGLALNFSHLRTRDAEARKKKIIYRFPDNIEDRDAPFPLAMILIIFGTLIWVFFYILGTGLLGVKI